MWSDMAKTASHAHAEGAHQLGVGMDSGVCVIIAPLVINHSFIPITPGRRSLPGVAKEIRVEKQAQPKDTAGIPINLRIQTVLGLSSAEGVDNLLMQRWITWFEESVDPLE